MSKNKTYGVLIGRFQPFHLGHQAIISEIIADGLEPVIVIGSSLTNDVRNPYSATERISMIRRVYPNLHLDRFICARDMPDNIEWRNTIIKLLQNLHSLPQNIDEFVIYYHRKVEDLDQDGNHYIDLFRDKVAIQGCSYPEKINIGVSATDIRADLENNRHYLDGRVYQLLRKKK